MSIISRTVKLAQQVQASHSIFAVLGRLVAGMCAAMLFSLIAAAQTVPNAVIYTSTQLVTINGNAGHIAANNLGDAFYESTTDHAAYWLKRGTTTPVALVTGLSDGGAAGNIEVDANNNVYVSSNYDGRIILVPYVGGTYATNIANSGSLPNCPFTPTVPCLTIGNGAGATGYYLQTSDLAFDQAINLVTPKSPPGPVYNAGPNVYILDERDNVCNQSGPATSCNTILKGVPNGDGTYTISVLVTGLPQTNNGQIAAGPKGDVYYADGANVYYIAAGTTKATMIGTGLTNPTGVTTDIYGNLYITNASAPDEILQMPELNGVAQPAQQFTYLNLYSANGVGIDNLGHIYYTGYSGGTNLNVATINSFNLGSAAVGSLALTTAQTLNVLFTQAATVATLAPVGTANGFIYTAGTCAAGAFTVGSSCTVLVNYKPTSVGLQTGSVELTTASGSVIAAADLAGSGLGPAETNDPGTLSNIGTTFNNPQGIAVDGSGNVYIADAGANTITMYPSGSTTGTSLGSGLSKPTSVALDNSGNLYIADSGNGRVVQVPSIAGVLTTASQSTVISGLGSDLGIATDLNSNLYIADSTKNQVLKLAVVSGLPNASAVNQIGTTAMGASIFTAPLAITTDPTGNIFVADTAANTVTEITYYGKQVIAIGTNYSHPSGLATDASGSLYVADPGNNRLIKIPFESPIYNTNDQYSVGASINAPFGVALDASGNLYVVDSTDATANKLNRLQGTVVLGRANINTTTPAFTGYVADSGNQNLTLGTPDYTATGNTTNFNITSPSSNGCTNGISLVSGFACTLVATFSPGANVGNYSEQLAFSSNAINTGSPTLTLTGTGLNQATTSTALVQTTPPSGNPTFGQTVTITAAVSSTKAGTPTGTVAFSVDGGQPKNIALNGTTAVINLTGLTGGTHVISATYSGDLNFAPSNASITVTVTRATTTTIVVQTTGNSNPNSALPGHGVTFEASVIPSQSTVPTGTVTFSLNGSPLAAPVPVAPSSDPNCAGYCASLTISTLPSGSDTIVATYSGDTNYLSSSSSLTTIIGSMDLSLTPTTASVTIADGQTATLPFQISSISGFGGGASAGAYVGLSCTGLPANAVCSFNPNSFPLYANTVLSGSGPDQITLQILTATSPVVPTPPVGELRIPGMQSRFPVSLAFLALLPLALLGRRKAKRIARMRHLASLVILLGSSLSLFSGCGSGSGPTTSDAVAYAPKGTYQVTVYAAATAPSALVSNGMPATTSYAGPLGPGCAYSPAGAVNPTCTQTAQVTLVIQ
jgi:trimeric autotransporter adhesin